MIEVAEHFYADDPARGHPDVRTRLAGASYFLLGNGFIQAAVQFAPEGEGTPLGLIVQDPERLGPKRAALTMDETEGLRSSVVCLVAGDGQGRPAAGDLHVEWAGEALVPTVVARWRWGGFEVEERFFCPDRESPRLTRLVSVRAASGPGAQVRLHTGVPGLTLDVGMDVTPGSAVGVCFEYALDAFRQRVTIAARPATGVDPAAGRWWSRSTTLRSSDHGIDRLFASSVRQLPAVVSARGRLDGSLWQYNREWVRDQALEALGLAMAGHAEIAAVILRRLLGEFITDDGAPVDSSEVRAADEAELDQNGVLLHVLHEYVAWTGDLDLVAAAWSHVRAVAEYPLRPAFRHASSGLLCNSREFWERHDVHGIEPGLELVYQVFVSLGLRSAAALASKLGHRDEASRWAIESDRLRDLTLTQPGFALVDERGLVKRRRLDGGVQETVTPRPDARLPGAVPLAGPGQHLLNPDTCTVLPLVFGFVDPGSDLAHRTLDHVESLWNQAWSTGGYGRYHVSSEPDSPGPWPFASMFVARAAVEAGRPAVARRVVDWLDTVPGAAAGSWFEFYGPRIAPPYPQVGIIPWTWAELIMLVVGHLLGVRPDLDRITVRPRLLPGITRASATVPVRAGRLHLELRADEAAREVSFACSEPTASTEGGTLRIPFTGGDVTVEAVLPATGASNGA